MIDLIIFILHTCWFTIIHTVLRGPKGLLHSFHFLATLGEGREGDTVSVWAWRGGALGSLEHRVLDQ